MIYTSHFTANRFRWLVVGTATLNGKWRGLSFVNPFTSKGWCFVIRTRP